MEIVTGDFGGYRLALQSVTGEAHSVLTRISDAERQAIRLILHDAIERLVAGDLLVCTESASDERKLLLALDALEHARVRQEFDKMEGGDEVPTPSE